MAGRPSDGTSWLKLLVVEPCCSLRKPGLKILCVTEIRGKPRKATDKELFILAPTWISHVGFYKYSLNFDVRPSIILFACVKDEKYGAETAVKIEATRFEAPNACTSGDFCIAH